MLVFSDAKTPVWEIGKRKTSRIFSEKKGLNYNIYVICLNKYSNPFSPKKRKNQAPFCKCFSWEIEKGHQNDAPFLLILMVHPA